MARIGILPLGRPTFDVAFAEEMLAGMLDRLDASGHEITGPRELLFDGDAARAEILELAGAKGAAMLVVTVDDRAGASAMVRAFRKLAPGTPIFARARDKAHAQELMQSGANFVIPEAVEAGLQLAGRALEEFGYDGDSVRTRLALERDSEYMKATDG